MDRPLVFNNAGARILSNGHKREALDLFRGALETQLATERRLGEQEQQEQQQQQSRQQDSQSSSGGGLSLMEGFAAAECVLRAEQHLLQIERYTAEVNRENQPDLEAGVLDPVIPYSIQEFNPFLCLQPFELPSNPSASTRLASAIIVCNLGIVYHYANRTSPKAAALYEVSAAILAGEPLNVESAMIRVALMNNYGVWCYEKGEGSALRTCMEHLSLVLENEVSTDIDRDIRARVERNVMWLLTPPNGGSPVA